MKIKKVEIEGFRAYKAKREGTFDFTLDGETPANFVAIYAPNGFGKSSFYDAVEWAFTNNLQRYAWDQNRKNNELAARSTKVNGVPQYILRNKDAGPDSTTSVSVYTTRRDYPRALGTIRHDSRDLRFNEADTEAGSEVFRSVILSQDAIDRFLREVKPQERYNLFMEFFGGDSERLRQEITAVRSDNRTILDNLRTERAELETQLQEPVDESVFAAFNALALSLNADGESIKLVSQDFSAKLEHEILAAIVARNHELKTLLNVQLTTKDTLNVQLSRFPEIQHVLDSLAHQDGKLAVLREGVADSSRYEQWLRAIDKNLEDIQSERKYTEFLQYVEIQLPFYFSELEELRRIEERRSSLVQERSTFTDQLSAAASATKLHKELLLTADKQSLELHAQLNGAGTVYQDISAAQARLAALDTQMLSLLASLEIEHVDHNRLTVELNELGPREFTRESIASQDLSVLNLDESEFSEVKQLAYQLDLLDVHESQMRSAQAVVAKQMGLVENLVLLGLEYVSNWPTEICPLCQIEHPSAGDLKAAVEGNNVLSAFAAENAKALEKFNILRDQLLRQLDPILAKIRNKKTARVAELQSRLTSLGIKINTLERDRDVAQSQIGSIQHQILSLQAKVRNLKQEDFVARLSSEIEKLEEHRNAHLAGLADATLVVESLERNLAVLKVSLSHIDSAEREIITKSSHRNVSQFMTVNGISADNLVDFHAQALRKSLRRVDELMLQKQELFTNSQNLQEKMVAAGTWIDFATLATLKEDLEKQVLSLAQTTDSFFKLLENLLSTSLERNLETARVMMSQKIVSIEMLCRGLGQKVEKLELLQEQLKTFRPYVQSLSLREALSKVERKLSKHMQVDKRLTDELSIILEDLRGRIGEFFYTDLINAIYSKIDPHPSFKKVDFVPDFSVVDKPGLNVVIADQDGEYISPNLYFSAAQLNILSLSVFLARALHAKDNSGDPIDTILIDDPVQSMDSINVLSTIDLLRNISIRFNKQIIISTHNENFFGLLQRKIPSEKFASKFLTLETFGVVAS